MITETTSANGETIKLGTRLRISGPIVGLQNRFIVTDLLGGQLVMAENEGVIRKYNLNIQFWKY